MQETQNDLDGLISAPRMDEKNKLMLPEALADDIKAQLDTTRGAANHIVDALASAAKAVPAVKTFKLASEADEYAWDAVGSATKSVWGSTLNTVGIQTTDEMDPNANLEAAKAQAKLAVQSTEAALDVALNPVTAVKNAIAESKNMLSSAKAAVSSAANGNFFSSGSEASSSEKKAA